MSNLTKEQVENTLKLADARITTSASSHLDEVPEYRFRVLQGPPVTNPREYFTLSDLNPITERRGNAFTIFCSKDQLLDLYDQIGVMFGIPDEGRL